MRFIIVLSVLLLMAACQSVSPRPSAQTSPVQMSEASGESIETAVVVDASNEQAGVEAEYRWLRAHFPGSSIEGQSLLTPPGDRVFDRFEIKLPDGGKRQIYFDISKYFGKF